MEQGGGISIITPPSLTDNNVGKTKSNGLTSTTASRIMSAKEKLRVPWKKSDDSVVEWMKKGLAELTGTAILMLVGCLGCVGGLGNTPTFIQSNLSFGFAVITAITCVGHISGAHLNPAVTVGAVVSGQQSLMSALLYIVSQTAGAIIGFGLLKLITPSDLLHGGDSSTIPTFCTTMLHPRVSLLQGFLAEVLATAVLVFMSCAVGDIRNSRNTDSTALKFGLAVAGLCFAFAPYTGCSMNPSRSFGPALLNNQWADHWIYWFGPFAGALLGSLLYKTVFVQRNKQEITITPENGV